MVTLVTMMAVEAISSTYCTALARHLNSRNRRIDVYLLHSFPGSKMQLKRKIDDATRTMWSFDERNEA